MYILIDKSIQDSSAGSLAQYYLGINKIIGLSFDVSYGIFSLITENTDLFKTYSSREWISLNDSIRLVSDLFYRN